MENKNDLKYALARKRVKQLKGLYIHAFVFVMVNLFLIFLNFMKHGSFRVDFSWGIVLWGFGFIAHFLSVFVPNFFLGSDWEERKIREFMNKNK